MAHIKKLVIQGFKSFAKRTEIPFDKGINVIIGPNGSGKTNISDSICFVLGRLSVKSMRAEKARNLIFMGSKYVKPAKEAFVEIVFDNSDRIFAIDTNEIMIKRGVRHNGQGIYKINGESKTRAEVIETLAQAGIDPYGFNLILQGQIQSIVRMHSEERRKIIEEVAGISIYESRKEKSLNELNKTDERLKEVSMILRERTAYLNNLEKERAQAKKYQELKTLNKRIRASILKKKLDEKKKETESIKKAIEEKTALKDKKRLLSEKAQEDIEKISEKINQMNRHIQKTSGLEQGALREEITNLKAELEGLRVRKEGYENRMYEVERRIEEMNKSVPELEREIHELRERSPHMAKKSKELKKKKDDLALLEEERRKILSLKATLNSLRDRIEDKKKQLARINGESEILVRQIEELSADLNYNSEKNCSINLDSLRKKLFDKRKESELLLKRESEYDKIISLESLDIKRNHEIKDKIEKIDVCPLCQSKMSESHIKHVFEECELKIKEAKQKIEEAEMELNILKESKTSNKNDINDIEKKIYSCDKELIKHRSIGGKNDLLNKYVEEANHLKEEISGLEKKKRETENRNFDLNSIEEKYRAKMFEIEEISSRSEEDVDTTLLYKERELEKIRNVIGRSKEDFNEIQKQVESLARDTEEKEDILIEKEKNEKKLNLRFNEMFSERDKMQKTMQELNINLSNIQNELRQIEDQINYLKIGKAKLDGEYETIGMDMSEYVNVEIIPGSIVGLEEKLKKIQETLENIGSINMRALEVYDLVKNEYDSVSEKVSTLEKEKQEIMKIIDEIDKKKYRSFMKTFKAINELFSRNFSKLSDKGVAYLEVENQENIFDGGVNIAVKMAKGKYFDVNSLSGGEQTLVALSLLFAIQEFRPYQFYILDEIDAALDKRNSERLAGLLNQYMKSGQYIVVTHNDALILNSQVLYGVSMHEGISKILSLRLSEEAQKEAHIDSTQENN